MKYYIIILFTVSVSLFAQNGYNHPEIKWQTVNTEHFKIHFYEDTELLAREAAGILEYAYPKITQLYRFEPKSKTHIIFTDVEDIANGAAYYYDNKILIWASPLDIALRGSHKWLENVLTHEFVHIISIQKAMKAGTIVPGAFLQWFGYEKETHKNELYGYPNVIASYAIPASVVPPWLAEGVAQFMYEDADWDIWDSHRDMILRDQALNNDLFTFAELNIFGKCGIGNESVYNSGYAFVNFITAKFGAESVRKIMHELSSPFQYSINKVLKKITGISGKRLYEQYVDDLTEKYKNLTEKIDSNLEEFNILSSEGTANLYPKWSQGGDKIAYISNKGNDFFSQTNLYIYDFTTGEEEKIVNGVQSAPTWGAGDSIIYYSKKPVKSSWSGYRYFDLYSYNINRKQEKKLTNQSRAVSPVYLNQLNSIAYIAMNGGKQSIFLYFLEKNNIKKIKTFEDARILHNLYFDEKTNRILFDYTTHHYRNIAALNLVDFSVEDIQFNTNFDERDMCVADNGDLIFSSDSNGIFNIMASDSATQIINFTNISGGAFMPDVNKDGQIVFALYQNGGYKIAVLEEPKKVKSTPYKPVMNIAYKAPINQVNSSVAEDYNDNFAQMFIMPRIMVDYGKIKPGLYFYSSEILDKLSISGGAAMNFDNDVDFGFNLSFRKLYPTVYTEFFFGTRNTIEKSNYSVYDVDDRLRFQFVQMQLGLKFPFLGPDGFDIYTQAQRYRAFIKKDIIGVDQKVGYAYDYYQGLSTGIKLKWNSIKPTVDRNINPSMGFSINSNFRYEFNDIIDGLNLSNSSTLVEKYKANNYFKIDIGGAFHKAILPAKRWTLNIAAKGELLSNTKVDSFFNIYGGGLDGIQGYPYYSFEGSKSIFSEISLRIPLFRQVHIPLGWVIWQNSTIGFEYQFGDAWTNNFDLKQSLGLQFRLNGFSFYNYPTALGFEVHRGLSTFTEDISGTNIKYGDKNRYYLTLLFGF